MDGRTRASREKGRYKKVLKPFFFFFFTQLSSEEPNKGELDPRVGERYGEPNGEVVE